MEPLDDDSTDRSRVRHLGSHVFIGASDLVLRELSFYRVPDEPYRSAAALRSSIMRPVLFIGGSVLVPELIRSCVTILGDLRASRRFETDATDSGPRGGNELRTAV